jgi:hypothetical protein
MPTPPLYGSSQYSGRQLNLTASGGGMGLPFDPSVFLEEALRERRSRAALEAESMRLRNRGMAGEISEAERLRRERRNPRGEGAPDPVKQAEDAARIAQAQAISGVAPQSVQGLGFNMTPGYMPNPAAMTGAQRQVFLPQNSTMQSPGSAGLGESRAASPGKIVAGEYASKPSGGGEADGSGGGSGGGGGGSEERADWNKTGTTNLAKQQAAGQEVGQRMGAELAARNYAQALDLPDTMIPWLMTAEGQAAASRALTQGLKINPRGGTEASLGGNVGEQRPATVGIGPMAGTYGGDVMQGVYRR